MDGWLHPLNGHGLEQTPGDTEGQGSLAYCSLWGGKQLDTSERLNNKSLFVNWTSCLLICCL